MPMKRHFYPFLPYFSDILTIFVKNSLKDTLSHYKSYKNTAWDVYSPTFHTWLKLPGYSSTSLHILKASFQVYIYLGQYIYIAYASYNILSLSRLSSPTTVLRCRCFITLLSVHVFNLRSLQE